MRVVLFALASAPALAWVSPPKAEAARRVRGQPLASHTNIYPMFTINDMEKAKPHLDGMVEATKAEEGCLYYGRVRVCGSVGTFTPQLAPKSLGKGCRYALDTTPDPSPHP